MADTTDADTDSTMADTAASDDTMAWYTMPVDPLPRQFIDDRPMVIETFLTPIPLPPPPAKILRANQKRRMGVTRKCLRRAQFVRRLVAMSGQDEYRVHRVLNALPNAVMYQLARYGAQEMEGLGTFRIKKKRARAARHGQTPAGVVWASPRLPEHHAIELDLDRKLVVFEQWFV